MFLCDIAFTFHNDQLWLQGSLAILIKISILLYQTTSCTCSKKIYDYIKTVVMSYTLKLSFSPLTSPQYIE